MGNRVLVADSDPTLADIYQSFFSSEGYEVETTADGLECLKRTRQRVPDVLVLEYELPWGGGEGVLANLREEYPFMLIGVVLLTCDYSVEDLSDELEPPVVGCLRKPFRLRELLEIGRSITQEQPATSASGLLKELIVHSRKTAQQP